MGGGGSTSTTVQNTTQSSSVANTSVVNAPHRYDFNVTQQGVDAATLNNLLTNAKQSASGDALSQVLAASQHEFDTASQTVNGAPWLVVLAIVLFFAGLIFRARG